MSWDKNTITSTKIDDVREVLRENNISYTVDVLGKVRARGQNDHLHDIAHYSIRKLSYQNYVIMEQMIRDPDCDIDDVITAQKFNKDNALLKNWEIEVEIDELTGNFADIEEGDNAMSGDREDLVCPRCIAPQNEMQEILQTNNPGFEWKCDNCGTRFKIKNTYKVIEIIGE